MNHLLKIAKEAGINFFGSVLGKILSYIWLMLMTRFLTPEDFGSFTIAQSIINISMIFVLFGSPRAMDRFIPFYKAKSEIGKVKALIFAILKVSVLLGFIVSITLFLSRGFISSRIFNDNKLDLVLSIMVFTIPMMAVINILSSIFIGYKELRYHVFINQLFFPIIKIVLFGIILIIGFGLESSTWMYFLSIVGTFFVASWLFHIKIGKKIYPVEKTQISFKDVFTYSWPLSVVSIVAVLTGQVELIILGVFRPLTDVGIYKIYFSLVAILSVGLTSLASIYKPVMSELVAKNDYHDLRNLYKRISKWFIVITLLGFLIISLVGNKFISLLLSREYSVVILSLYILASAYLINALAGPDGMTLQAFGNTKLAMGNAFLMLIFNILFGLLLIPSYGVIGAAIAHTIGVSSAHLTGMYQIYRLHNLHPFSKNHLKFIGAAIITTISFYVFEGIIGFRNLFELIVASSLIGVIFIGSIFILKGFDHEDKMIIKSIQNKLTRK